MNGGANMKDKKVYIEHDALDDGYAYCSVVEYQKEYRNLIQYTDYVCNYGDSEIFQDPYNFEYYSQIT